MLSAYCITRVGVHSSKAFDLLIFSGWLLFATAAAICLHFKPPTTLTTAKKSLNLLGSFRLVVIVIFQAPTAPTTAKKIFDLFKSNRLVVT